MHAYHPTKELYIISTRHGYDDFKMIDGNLLYLMGERCACQGPGEGSGKGWGGIVDG